MLLGYIPPCLADYRTQLGFVVASVVLRAFRDIDGGRVGADQRGAGFGEENGRFGKREIGLLKGCRMDLKGIKAGGFVSSLLRGPCNSILGI